MFRSSWFGKVACRTGGPGVKQPSVIWVNAQLTGDFLLCYRACREERVNKARDSMIKTRNHATKLKMSGEFIDSHYISS